VQDTASMHEAQSEGPPGVAWQETRAGRSKARTVRRTQKSAHMRMGGQEVLGVAKAACTLRKLHSTHDALMEGPDGAEGAQGTPSRAEAHENVRGAHGVVLLGQRGRQAGGQAGSQAGHVQAPAAAAGEALPTSAPVRP
jgi:hypothetical protein